MKKTVLIYELIIMISILCSCTSTGFHFKTKNIDINFEKVEGWDEKSQIKGHTGDFSLRGNGKTPFYYTDDGRPCIKVKISNYEKEVETYLLIDTGAPGVAITRKIIEKLNGKKSNYKFLVQLVQSYNKESASYGYYFDKLEAEGFCISNVLMQDLFLKDNTSFGCTKEGFEIEGCLGIEFLMKSNVVISYSTDELFFLEDEKQFIGETVKLKSSCLKKHRINTPIYINNRKYEGNIDTGAEATLIDSNQLKKMKKSISFIVDERAEKYNMRYCTLENVQFFGKKIEKVPVWSSAEKGVISTKTMTIGNYLLKIYDIFIDWNKGEITYMSHNKYVPDFNLEKCITDNKKGLFGICLDKHGNKWFVDAKHYINEKPMIEGVEVGDELLSINGVKISNFDWESWSDLEEADFEFLHNGEIISKKLKRRHIDEFL